MSYSSAIEALYALGHELGKPRKFDLQHMVTLAAALGNPQRRFPAVLVAGTNGKGSTSATLASILHTAGYRTALYTSPHLLRINERIQIDGESISDAEFTEMYDRVDSAARKLVASGALPLPPSFFEMLTAMAFEYFASAGVEIAVLEVGMGGRLDATNIADPCISVITDVALDHQQYLGDTIATIAVEKAGIIRQNGVLVTLPQHPEANDAIGRIAVERNARGVSATKYVPNVTPGAARFDHLRPTATQLGQFLRTRYFLEVLGEEVLIETPLVGRHQLRNTALAIAAAEELNQCGFTITAQDIATGIRDTYWPGRFQLIPGAPSVTQSQVGKKIETKVAAPPLSQGDRVGSPDFILDVAHNPAGAWALRSALSEHFAESESDLTATTHPITFIFGAMRDKAIAEIAQILFPLAQHVIATHADSPRAATTDELRELAGPAGSDMIFEPTVAKAIERARAVTPQNGVVVITGSIYIVGEAFAILQSRAKTAQ
ncbi:MAG: FolC bifunctional protein [Acidobacteriaceae bacterium]|nr:FolC bifunctional protein [Acidobacteriaceae bacterium]